MTLQFPSSPITGQRFENWQWDGEKWTPYQASKDAAVLPIGGRMSLLNGLNIIFNAYEGDWIRIAGEYYPIPANGIRASWTNIYLNGVAGQSLVAANNYYVYLFNNNGILTIDYSLTGHQRSVTPGNVGTEIKNGDESRTLIGFVRCSSDAANRFQESDTMLGVRSWLNRPSTWFLAIGSQVNVSNGNWLVGASVNILAFGSQTVYASAEMAYVTTDLTNAGVQIQLRVNGGINSTRRTTAQDGGSQYTVATSCGSELIEGLNTVAVWTAMGGTQTNYNSVSGMLLP